MKIKHATKFCLEFCYANDGHHTNLTINALKFTRNFNLLKNY